MPASSTPRRRRPDPRYQVEVIDHTGRTAGTDAVREAVLATLSSREVPRGAISVAIVDDAVIREVNVRHLGHDWATDVITFPGDDPASPPGTAPPAGAVFGELIISAETAVREAARRRVAPERELALYAIHGTLHLLGFDDQTPPDRARMRRAERKVLHSILPPRGRSAGPGGQR